MKQEELQKLLDSLMEGPLGKKTDGHWSLVNNALALTSNKEILKIRGKSISKAVKCKPYIKKPWISKALKGKPRPWLNTKEVIAKRVANIDYANRKHPGSNKLIRRPVIAIDKKGNETFFESITIAAKELTRITGKQFYTQNISAVLSPKRADKSTKGYTFKDV